MPKSAGSVRFDTGDPAPIFIPNGARVNQAAALTTSAAVSLSAVVTPGADNNPVVFVRSTDWIWLAFGTSGVAATATSASILCPPGEGLYVLDGAVTHFAVMRFSADCTVQIEGCR